MSQFAAGTTVTTGGRRVAGIDTRTVKPALLVLALAVLMSVVLPAIDGHTRYRDAIHAGDVAQIADGVTLVPRPRWDLAGGALAGHTRSPIGSTATTELVAGSVDFEVQAAPFDGTPAALLSRINRLNGDLERARGRAAATSDRYAVRTRQGAVGVAEDFAGVEKQGSIVAFVLRPHPRSTGPRAASTGEGVAIVVSGPRGSVSRRRDAIVAMIRSLRTAP